LLLRLFHTQIRTAASVSAQGDDEEECADTELEDTTLPDPPFTEENYEDLEWHHQLPSDKADVH
jgi:hypothetical protein